MDIIVLCGGLGTERDVSITSGTGVARALRKKGHRVILADLFTGIPGDIDPEALFASPQRDMEYSVSETVPDLSALYEKSGGVSIGPNILKLCKAADIVFLALHGGDGENGHIQAVFDMFGVKYTGCSSLCSSLAMNKGLSKLLFSSAGVPIAESVTLSRGCDNAPPYLPCVVKPCSGGSSVGTSIAKTAEEYEAALKLAFKYEESVLVEKYIKGREFTVGVIDWQPLPIIEIIPKTGFYDYKNKYQAGLTEELCPAPIPESDAERLRDCALKAGKALMLDSYYRADILMDEAGKLYCLEINTLPGMTPTSLVPQMAQNIGVDFGGLCEKIIETSMRKYDESSDHKRP